MRVYALMRLPCRPIFARHVAIVRSWCSPRQSVSLVVGPHAMKATAAGQLSFEVIDAGEFDIRPRRLIVIPIFIEPRYRIWTRSPVRRLMVLRNSCVTTLRLGLRPRWRHSQGRPRGGCNTEFEPASACNSIGMRVQLSHECFPFLPEHPDRQSNTPGESSFRMVLSLCTQTT